VRSFDPLLKASLRSKESGKPLYGSIRLCPGTLPHPGLKIVPQVVALIVNTQLLSNMLTVSLDGAWGDVQVVGYLLGC